MARLKYLFRRVQSLWRSEQLHNEIHEELSFHIEQRTADNIRRGMPAEVARRDAEQRFGGLSRIKEQGYELRTATWIEHFVKDLRYGMRMLRKAPGFTSVAVLTLALGIGANTAVFSVMNAVLLKSLPVTDPDRVFYLNTSGAPKRTGTIDSHETFSYPVYENLRQQHRGLTEVMAYVPLSTGKVAVRYETQPEEAEGDMVSGNFFSGLGIELARGRGFTEEDETSHAAIAVISHRYWTRRFSRSADALGKTMYVNGVPLTIVGIAAEGFEGVEPGNSTDFWIPLQARAELNAWGNPLQDGKTYRENATWWCLRMLGRLAPGITESQAAAQLQSAFQAAAYIGLANPEPGEHRPVLSLKEAKNFPGYDERYGKPLRILMAMVGFVLLIALTNVVMMLMARNATRQREFSLRLALGVGRGRLFLQLLTEALLLVVLGGGLAWLFATYATKALGACAQIESSLAPDHRVLGFTLTILVLAALLFGLAPLRIALSAGAGLVLKASSATSYSDAGKTRTGKIITALQMAVCVVLLVAGGLLMGTLRNLQKVSLGFPTDGLVVFGVNPQNIHSVPEGISFYRELMGKLRVLPGVESVTIMGERLGSWWSNNSDMMVDGKLPDVMNGTSRTVRSNVVGPDFFHTLGVPVLAGRDFTDSDTASSPHVGIINELFAQRFLPNQNPLGHSIGTEDGKYQMTIVGVVKDHKYRSINEEPIPMAWYMYAQIPTAGKMHVELRVHGEPLAILPAVRKVVQQMDPDLPLIQPMTQRAQYELTISHQLLFARLAGFFGLLAVLLVATGLYGTLAYRVNNRTAEIGVRIALGARRGQVVWMVLRDSLILTAIGVVIGVPLASQVAKALTSVLYGVKPYDPLSYVLAVGGIALVAIIASFIPAHRAANVDPLSALRAE
jgi:predicted permease